MSQILSLSTHYNRQDETEGVFINIDENEFFELVEEDVRNHYDDLIYRRENPHNSQHLDNDEINDLYCCMMYLEIYDHSLYNDEDSQELKELIDERIEQAKEKIKLKLINHTNTTKDLKDFFISMINGDEGAREDLNAHIYDLAHEAEGKIYKKLNICVARYKTLVDREEERQRREEQANQPPPEPAPQPAQPSEPLKNASPLISDESTKRANIKREQTKLFNIMLNDCAKFTQRVDLELEAIRTHNDMSFILYDEWHTEALNIINNNDVPNYRFCDRCKRIENDKPFGEKKNKIYKLPLRRLVRNECNNLFSCIKCAVYINERLRRIKEIEDEDREAPRTKLYDDCLKLHNDEYKKYLVVISDLNDQFCEQMTDIIKTTSLNFCDMCQTSGDNKLFKNDRLIFCDCNKKYCVDCIENMKKIHYENDDIIKSARCPFCRLFLE